MRPVKTQGHEKGLFRVIFQLPEPGDDPLRALFIRHQVPILFAAVTEWSVAVPPSPVARQVLGGNQAVAALRRIYAAAGVPRDVIRYLVRRGGAALVDRVVSECGADLRWAAFFFGERLKGLRRAGTTVDELSAEDWCALFRAFAERPALRDAWAALVVQVALVPPTTVPPTTTTQPPAPTEPPVDPAPDTPPPPDPALTEPPVEYVPVEAGDLYAVPGVPKHQVRRVRVTRDLVVS